MNTINVRITIALGFGLYVSLVSAAQAQVTTKAIPRPLKGITITPFSKAGGALPRQEATVELVQAPGPEGLVVKLESSHPQFASVPDSVTFTHGAQSSETGVVVKKSFYITTQPVREETLVTIRARVGAQVIEARLKIVPPQLTRASFNPSASCNGHSKSTLEFALTGPVPSGFTLHGSVRAEASNGKRASAGIPEEAVPTGNHFGTIRFKVPLCPADQPGQPCEVTGRLQLGGGTTFSIRDFRGTCRRPND